MNTADENQVTPMGHLPAGLEYRLNTFKILGHGDKLYMLARDVSRLTGYRDSYLFFVRNQKLHKIVTTRTERDDLVRREIIPFSSRYRPIGVVSARSVLKRFGRRVIIDREKSREDDRTVLQGPVLVPVVTEVQPKGTVPIVGYTDQKPGMASVYKCPVERQVTRIPQWKTILPCRTSAQRPLGKSLSIDQAKQAPAAQNRVADILTPQPLPSIRELFGNLQDPTIATFSNNHLQLSTRSTLPPQLVLKINLGGYSGG
jgi:hypothetical protein